MKSPAIARATEAFLAEVERAVVARQKQLIPQLLARLEPKRKRGRPPKLSLVP